MNKKLKKYESVFTGKVNKKVRKINENTENINDFISEYISEFDEIGENNENYLKRFDSKLRRKYNIKNELSLLDIIEEYAPEKKSYFSNQYVELSGFTEDNVMYTIEEGSDIVTDIFFDEIYEVMVSRYNVVASRKEVENIVPVGGVRITFDDYSVEEPYTLESLIGIHPYLEWFKTGEIIKDIANRLAGEIEPL